MTADGRLRAANAAHVAVPHLRTGDHASEGSQDRVLEQQLILVRVPGHAPAEPVLLSSV
jgi:hypothetical protein